MRLFRLLVSLSLTLGHQHLAELLLLFLEFLFQLLVLCLRSSYIFNLLWSGFFVLRVFGATISIAFLILSLNGFLIITIRSLDIILTLFDFLALRLNLGYNCSINSCQSVDLSLTIRNVTFNFIVYEW